VDDTVIELLIAVKLRKLNYPTLFHATSTAVSRVSRYAILGSGRAVQYNVQELYNSRQTVSRGVLIAVQLLSAAKAALSSVGGRGRIVTINFGEKRMGVADLWQVEQTEEALKAFLAYAGELMLDFSDLEIDDETFRRRLEKDFVAEVTQRRQVYRTKSLQWKAFMDALLNPNKITPEPSGDQAPEPTNE
jgi:hypothetical protein